MPHAAQNLAARFQHHIGGVLFQVLSEGVIGGEEEPAVEALLDGRKARDIGLRECIEHVMHGVWTAGLVGEADRSGTVEHVDLAARLRDLERGQRGGRCRHVEQHLDALIVEHVAGDIGGKVGLVEMIGRDDLDLAAQHFAAEILRCHLRGCLAAWPGNVGVETGHIEDAAEFEWRLALRHSRSGGKRQHRCEYTGKYAVHCSLPANVPHSLRPQFQLRQSCRKPSTAASSTPPAAMLVFPQNGMSVRASSSSVASSFETRLTPLLRMRSCTLVVRSQTLMVRSAATPRVSNHEATGCADMRGILARSASYTTAVASRPFPGTWLSSNLIPSGSSNSSE